MSPLGGVPPLPAPPARTAVASPWPGILLRLATVAVGVWVIAVTAALHGVAWLVNEVLSAVEVSPPGWAWPAVAWLDASLVALPAGLLWLLAARVEPAGLGVRAAARAWTLMGVAAGALGSVRAVPVADNELLLAMTAVVAVGLSVAIGRLGQLGRLGQAGHAGEPPGAAASRWHRALAFAVAAGAGLLVPWLWVGALGGAVETALGVAAAAAVGLLGARVLDAGFFASFDRSRWWQILVGGLAAGVTLVPLGAAVGGQGVNLAEMLVLPCLGFAAASLAGLARTRPPTQVAVAGIIALAALGPLAWVDPEETSILLGADGVGTWALLASLLSVAIGLAAGLGYGLALRPGGRLTTRSAAVVVVVLAVVAGAGVYAVAGQPGLYGERLLVILSDQADLTGLDRIATRPQRLDSTYHRLVAHAEATQAPLRHQLDRFGLHYTPYYLLNAVMVDAGLVLRPWLAARPDVSRVLLDQRLRPLPVPIATQRGSDPEPDGSPQWNISLIGADRAWHDFSATGQNIVIGTSDSGVDGQHPLLSSGFRGGADSWYDPWNGTATPTDHNGHGSHTLGIALGRHGIGVAPGAQWIGCVNLDRNLGSPSRYLDCLQFMLAPFPHGGDAWRDGRAQRAPHILTNSWGCPPVEGCDAEALRPATAALAAAGIFFVAAAGNAGPRCRSVGDPPAPYPDVLTVGAVDRTRTVADFSSRGPTADGLVKPDVVAPGVDVLSALPDATYGRYDGTSMAAPHVAGVVALMWSANPALIGNIEATTQILTQTAAPASTPAPAPASTPGGCRPADVTGAGLVDAYAAVRAASRLPGATAHP